MANKIIVSLQVGCLAVFGIGLWIIIEQSFANELLGTNLFAGSMYVLTTMSFVGVVASIVGFFGARKEIKFLLLTYFIIVFILFVTILIGGILGYVFREKVEYTMRQEMRATIRLYGSKKLITEAWDTVQTRLHCCGVDYYRDWKGRVPNSCCKEIYGGQRKPCVGWQTLDNTYNDGCYNVTAVTLQQNANIISGAGIGLSFIMIFSLVFSCILFCVIK